jgi:hypothetical protein
MKKSQQALSILAQIKDLIESELYCLDNSEPLKRFTGLQQILKMHTSNFLPDSTFRVYLGEQIGKLDEYKDYFFDSRRPSPWRTHEECRSAMIKCCLLTQGLIERHAQEFENRP